MLSPTPFDPHTVSQDRTSLDSDTGNVLIRSTRVFLPNRGHENEPGSVQITVQKLRDHEQVQVQQHHTEQQRRGQRPRQKLGSGHSERAAAEIQTGQELLTSRFTAGGRQAVLGALKQRSHSAPHRREVRVQLLDPEPLQTKTNQNLSAFSCQDADVVVGVQSEARPSSGYHGDTSSAAAAAAAAVAAAAPIIKAQSDLEARVTQLADGMQKLLHTSREAEDRGWRMSQQRLQHQEALQSLQLQNQLLESTLKMVTDRASTTPEVSASAHRTSRQHPSSSTTDVEAAPVTMETRRCDDMPERSRRDELHLQSVSKTEASHPQSSACHSQEAVRSANEMLRRMGSLAAEMKLLLTPEDSPESIRPAPDPLQVQENQLQSQEDQLQSHQSQSHQDQPSRNYSQNNQFPIKHSQFHQRQSNQKRSQDQQSYEYQSPSQNLLSHQTTSQRKPPQSPHCLFHQDLSHQNHIHQPQFQLYQPPLVQKKSSSPSMLEEAGQVLRQAQRQKKVLEENLEALLKTKTGEILHCQLEALAANRDWTEEVWIKKTVDTWINTLTSDIQAEVSSVDAAGCRSADTVTSQQKAAGTGRPASKLRATRPMMEKKRRRQPAGPRMEAESLRVTGIQTSTQQAEVDRELHLSRMYGKVPYNGLRRTLKKSPYLQFSSPPSPLSRKSRPRLVESIRGVRLKSCKTQTSFAPPFSPSPGQPQQHHVFISSYQTSHEPANLTMHNSFPVTMAIPLGRPRTEPSSRTDPSFRCERTQEDTSVSTSVVTVGNGVSDQQKQQLDENQAPSAPSSPTAPPARSAPSGPSAPSHVVILERHSEEDKEEEDNIFPGTESLFVADVYQEEVEEAVILDGGPSPTPVLYHGPAFPPEVPHSDQVQTPVLAINQQQDILENRLVEWVSQQLMSRMITEFYPPAVSDPAHSDNANHSELMERSLSSDIVEAAGAGDLQLFVHSNTSVDSDLIRKLVNEVLTETVVQMLDQKDSLNAEEPGLNQPESEPKADNEEKLPLVPTPAPSPLPCPAQSSREAIPVTTPPPSEPVSPLEKEPPQPITAADLVATPTTTPEPQFSEGNPPALQHSLHPPTWGDTELPLDEERPDEHPDIHKQSLWMSVAEEEPPLCSPLPPPTIPPAPAPPSSEESSSCSSSSTVTAGTEAALKHISEGELLISINQLAPLTEEEALCSFSSSLQELQDMDFDPPSAEQVRGRNLLLTLLTKMDQGVSHPQLEGSWGMQETEEELSVGEMRDYEATTPVRSPDLGRQDPTFSPGQSCQTAAVQQEEEKQGEARKMEDPLTFIRLQEEEEEVMEEPLSAASESDSSTNDIF
ncbi:protein TALPID3 isoform X2 [Melanotaenia boesemani]|uniref:protein TALPID3 isoform X2 n=1 Tax=Melanotaenia boesemani TaxID=1250792 RepID=UPI001C04A200|nr:protein TALPID3 isoform X2 [Melanotaenia boesemani]